jgi:hypothetical protein
MTTAAPGTTPVPQSRDSRIAQRTTVVLAGLLGGLMMYWTWRGPLGVPLELKISMHLDDQLPPVRPWAPWWAPTGILLLLTMMLWRILAAHARRISALGGTLALVLASVLTFPVAFLCLELGAVAQYDPLPPINRILAVLPLMLVESIASAILFLLMNGIAMLPAAALLGLINAGFGDAILWIERRRRRPVP